MGILKDLTVLGASRFIGNAYFTNITANQFIKSGGTSSQFLKADGSVDSSTYLIQTTFNSGNPDLAAIEALTGTSGFLKKTATNTWSLDTNTYLTQTKTLKTDNTTAQTASSSETISGSGTINLHKVAKTGTYTDLLSKPTIPATNIIPAITTANKVLLSTTTSGTAAWSAWSSAGFLKTNTSGVVSIDTNTYLTTSSASSTYAPKVSPALTGTPTAPTAATGTNTTQLATTAFVQQELSGITTDIEDNEKVIAAALTDLEDRKANTDDLGQKIISLQENGSTTAGTWLAKTNEITSLVDGQLFYYKITVAGASTTTLNITNSGNTALGAKTIYVQNTTKLTTHFAVGCYVLLAYNTVNDCFRVVNNYDSNSTTVYGYYDLYFRPYAAETIYRYKLVALDNDGRLHPITLTDQTNGTIIAKTPTSAGLKPYKLWTYNSTTTTSAGTVVPAQILASATHVMSPVYTFNTSIPAYRLIYLKGTYNAALDLFYLYIDNSSPCTSFYVSTPTNTANINLSNYFTAGYYYWLVGGTYSSADTASLFDENPLYYFDGTNLIPANIAVNSKWYGTEDEFDALTTLDDNTDYYIYDE